MFYTPTKKKESSSSDKAPTYVPIEIKTPESNSPESNEDEIPLHVEKQTPEEANRYNKKGSCVCF